MARKHRKHSRKHALHGFFDPKNKWVWAGVGAAAVVLYVYRKELFGMGDGKVGYLAPVYNPAPTFQG
jgi:hypothetical protein